MAEGTLDITISNQTVILNQPPTGSVNALYNWWVATKSITHNYDDWFMPSIEELRQMFIVVNPPTGKVYLSSSELYGALCAGFDATMFPTINAYSKNVGPYYVWACRSFASSTSYSVGDPGPAGGIIFYIDGSTYYEAAPLSTATIEIWGDVATPAGCGDAIGTGQNNTALILAVSGMTTSAAEVCDDLLISFIITPLLPPVGWHVPSQAEFQTLETYLGGASIAGGKLKELGFIHWDSPNTGADNSSGFTALGSGQRFYDGTFLNGGISPLKQYTNFWTTTADTPGVTQMVFYLYYNGNDSNSTGAQSVYADGNPIRLIKDNSIDPGQMTDYDGNVYNTVKIGDQVWMASNLQVTHFNNGIEIPNITDNAEWAAMTSEAMCYYGDATPPTPTPSQTGSPAAFRIYISEACSLTYEVFPLNFLSTTLVDELESGKLFYRRKFNGTLIFGSNSRVKDFDGIWHNRCDDWSLFWGFEQTDPCAKRYIQITKIVGGVVYPYWDGYFSTTDGKWDIDRQLFEITPIENDEYSLILEDTKLQHDILIGTPEVSTNANDGVAINQAYTHNHWLMDVMQYLIDPGGFFGITVVSDFFTVATNYATGAANKLTKLTIAQKSDIKDPDASNPARFPKGQLSWDELMEILKGMFQVYWVYDHLTDTVHVEHISWFVANDGLDLRTQALCYKTNKYSYAKEKMLKYESFKWMEADNAYFVGDSIRYDSGCVDQNPESNTVETSVPVTTDIEFIYNNDHRAAGESDKISDDGWVIFQNSGTGPIYDVDMELAAGSAEVRLNMHLSWSNLHDNYFRHNRVMIEGYINNRFTTFLSAQKTKKQECTAIVCVNYDPHDNITTELGETYFSGAKASVERASIHPTGEINFSLLYGTSYITPIPEPAVRWALITMVPSNFTDHCTHFHVLLSEGAPVGGLNIEFRYVILPGSGPAVCANAAGDDIWNIAEGLTTDEYDITLDCAIPTGGCIYYFHPGPGDVPGWTIDFIYDETCRC